jgi:hypothetical protein
VHLVWLGTRNWRAWRLEWHGPEAFHLTILASKCQEHDAVDTSAGGCFDRQAEYQPLGLLLPERHGNLLGSYDIPAQGSGGRIICQTAEEPHRHVLDQEDKVVALVEHGQPIVGPTLRDALMPLPAESISPSPYGPGVIAELR